MPLAALLCSGFLSSDSNTNRNAFAYALSGMNPFFASSIEGASTCSLVNVPYRLCAIRRPATVPGTPTAVPPKRLLCSLKNVGPTNAGAVSR